ncbi:hypothetical protein K439DRAFT_1613564 [Ramaria rubella]|nr:hypothetical protein K439DRAFT_1613564 [Ramaria rubella]
MSSRYLELTHRLAHAHDPRSFSIIPTLIIAALLPVCTSIAVDPANTTTHKHRSMSGHVYSNAIHDVALTFNNGPYKYHIGCLPVVWSATKFQSEPKVRAPAKMSKAQAIAAVSMPAPGSSTQLPFSPQQPLQPTKQQAVVTCKGNRWKQIVG